MKAQIETQVKQMLREYLGEIGYAYCGDVNSDSHLKNDLGMDSLDVCCILIEMEKHYDFNLSADEEEVLTNEPTVNNLVDVIYRKLN